jgi:hypothetical protein
VEEVESDDPMKTRTLQPSTTFKESSRGTYKPIMVKVGILLTSTMFVSSILIFNAQAQEASRLGLNTTLRTFGEDVKSMQELGVGRMRVALQWQLVRIRPGKYDWSAVDRLLKAAQTKNIEVLFTLRTLFREGTKNSRYQRDRIQSSPVSVEKEEWVRFVETLATRYRGQGVNYEFENEVNGEAFWKGTLEEYLERLKTGYDVIKKIDPQAKVLPSAMGCGIVRNFQLDSVQLEAWKWHDGWLQPILSTRKFDVVNIHNYYFPSDIVANGLTFRSYLEHIHDLMKKSGLGDRPIWITETGYVSSPADAGGRLDLGSPEKQAKWLTEAYEQAFEFGVQRIYWLLVRDRNEPYFGSMGLADAKGNPRPAWNAFHEFVKGK